MWISTRRLRMRPVATWLAERSRSCTVVAARLRSLGDREARPIWALPDAGLDERCRDRSRTSEADRHGGGE
jgi:hypothetical protein